MARGLRIVGGSAGGRRLVAPKGGARPTTDRVKEALFNVLGGRVVGAAVLDLYAGSGALGIEALSRGAARAVFVDDDAAAVDAIRENLAAAGFVADAQVTRVTVAQYVAHPARGESGSGQAGFDLVLLDPPYDTPTTDVDAVLAALGASDLIASGGRVVVERARAAGPPSLPSTWETEFQRAYGDTLLMIATS
jgi:16S rRNA (guanine(966)-N(2))-methyltransferase RsmD